MPVQVSTSPPGVPSALQTQTLPSLQKRSPGAHSTQPIVSTQNAGQSIALIHCPPVHVSYDEPLQRCAPSIVQSFIASGRPLPLSLRDGLPQAASATTTRRRMFPCTKPRVTPALENHDRLEVEATCEHV